MKPKVLVTLIVVALALVSAVLMYSRYLSKPWTRDAYVRANVVGIAPRVAGPIIEIPVVDNQSVKKGTFFSRSIRARSRRRGPGAGAVESDASKAD